MNGAQTWSHPTDCFTSTYQKGKANENSDFAGKLTKDKHTLLTACVKKAVEEKKYEIIHFGVFPDETIVFSYIQTALCISFLLESKAVDFVVTGCSSGQGMMLACNSLPGVQCGYVSNPSDAYLFGRINDGNAVSYPLGLNFGWAAEINLQSTMAIV